MEHSQAFDPIQDGRIYIEKINGLFLFGDKGTPSVNRRPTWIPPRLFTKSLKQKRNCLFPACSIDVQP